MKNFVIKYIILLLALTGIESRIHAQSVEIIQKQTPVLTLKEGNPVLTMKINAGKNNAIVQVINIDLIGV